MTLKEMLELRAAKVAELRALSDKRKAEKRAKFSEEEKSAWKKLEDQVTELDDQIAEEKRLESLEGANRAPAGDPKIGREDTPARQTTPAQARDARAEAAQADQDMGGAFRAWAATQARRPSLILKGDAEAAERVKVNPAENEFTVRLGLGDAFERRQQVFRRVSRERAYDESRALSTQIGATGGFTIAPLFNAAIESALLYYGPMMQVCEIIRTPTGADLPFMTDNETTKTGSYVGENAAITTTEGVTIGQTVLKSFRGTTNAILVPNMLFRDSSLNLQQYLGNKLGERLGRFLNTEATTGTVGKARGITARSTAATLSSGNPYTASASAITADELKEFKHSVDVAYRAGAAFMMADSIALYISKLKDAQGDYYWTNGFQNGLPDQLLGAPVYINNDMAAIAATAKVIEYGQLNAMKIRLVQDIRITMTDQRYWEYDQIGFAAYVDFDADLIDAGTHPVKHLAMHA